MKKILKSSKSFLNLTKKIIKKEKKIIYILLSVILLILIIPFISNKFLTEIPSQGGVIEEIKIDQPPRFINPVLAVSSSDKDFLPLIYTPVLERNPEGKIIPAAAAVSISEDKKSYNLELAEGIFFSNGEELTSDDVIFTIEKIQDPSLKSPYYSNWLKVKTEKIDKYNLKITLPEEYAKFKNILTTLYIMPKSAWTGIQPSEFPFAPLSTHPIGSGPYIISKIIRDQETGKIKKYQLEKNEDYYKGEIFIDEVNIHFFDNYQDYQNSLLYSDRKKVKNIASVDFDLIPQLSSKKSYLESRVEKIEIPKIFGLFLGKNYNSNLSNLSLRKAIALSINKKNITENILHSYARELNSIFPIEKDLPLEEENSEKTEKTSEEPKEESVKNENEEKTEVEKKEEALAENPALVALKKSIFYLNDEGVLINKKTKKPVVLKIATLKNNEFKRIAESLKKDLAEIGISTEIILYEEDKLINDVIRNRDFEILLYGYQLDIDPDPYYLFHSSQVQDPGINISGISNKKVDKLLLELRKNLSPEERVKKEAELEKIILSDYSFIPLYSPYFIYLMDGRIKNFHREKINSAEERFTDIDKWYSQTKKILPSLKND